VAAGPDYASQVVVEPGQSNPLRSSGARPSRAAPPSLGQLAETRLWVKKTKSTVGWPHRFSTSMRGRRQAAMFAGRVYLVAASSYAPFNNNINYYRSGK